MHGTIQVKHEKERLSWFSCIYIQPPRPASLRFRIVMMLAKYRLFYVLEAVVIFQVENPIFQQFHAIDIDLLELQYLSAQIQTSRCFTQLKI